jgi:hypothetical protein
LAAAVQGWVDAACEGVFAWQTQVSQVIDAGYIQGCIQALNWL